MHLQEDRLRSDTGRTGEPNQPGNKSRRKQKRKADAVDNAEAAALAVQGKGKGQPKQKKEGAAKNKNIPGRDILDQPCQVHTKRDEDGNLILPKHTT